MMNAPSATILNLSTTLDSYDRQTKDKLFFTNAQIAIISLLKTCDLEHHYLLLFTLTMASVLFKTRLKADTHGDFSLSFVWDFMDKK